MKLVEFGDLAEKLAQVRSTHDESRGKGCEQGELEFEIHNESDKRPQLGVYAYLSFI